MRTVRERVLAILLGVALLAGGASAQQSVWVSWIGGTVLTSIVPGTDNGLDLGSTLFRWRTGYFGTSVISPVVATGTGTGDVGFRDSGDRFQIVRGDQGALMPLEALELRSTGFLSLGSSPAQTGTSSIRMSNGQAMYWRNAADSSDINVLGVDASNVIGLGTTAGIISTVGSNAAVINGTLTTSTTSTCTAANTDETDLWSYSLPAGALSADGRGVRVTVFGTTAANANNKTIKGYWGATNVALLATAAYSNQSWKLVWEVFRTGATAQIVDGTALATNANTRIDFNTTAETLSGAVTIKVTGQNGTAAADDICVKGAVVETIK